MYSSRRLVERGTRFIQIYSGGAHNDSNWDAHGDLKKNHDYHAGRTDKPIAGLLKDLSKEVYLMKHLLFGVVNLDVSPLLNMPKVLAEITIALDLQCGWLGGIKGGVSVGTTDELGSKAVENPYHVKNLHATVLTLMGLDPNNLSYFYNGLDQKLVGVEGAEPIYQALA